MRKEEVLDLRIGNIVVVSSKNSKNLGKRGTVRDIIRFDGSANILVEPIDCQFEFSKGQEPFTKNGAYKYSHYALQLDDKPLKEPTKPIVNKEFYASSKFGKAGLHWSTSSFTSKELNVVDRFLKELNKMTSFGFPIEDITIIDKINKIE